MENTFFCSTFFPIFVEIIYYHENYADYLRCDYQLNVVFYGECHRDDNLSE